MQSAATVATTVAQDPWSPPTGILGAHSGTVGDRAAERLARGDEDDWHEERRNAERCYLGTLLLCQFRDGERATVKVELSDLHFDLHRILLSEIRKAAPWTDSDVLLTMLVGGAASGRYAPQLVREELADCMTLALPFSRVDEAAKGVHFHRARAERVRLLERMRSFAHDPATLRELCAKLLTVEG